LPEEELKIMLETNYMEKLEELLKEILKVSLDTLIIKMDKLK